MKRAAEPDIPSAAQASVSSPPSVRKAEGEMVCNRMPPDALTAEDTEE